MTKSKDKLQRNPTSRGSSLSGDNLPKPFEGTQLQTIYELLAYLWEYSKAKQNRMRIVGLCVTWQYWEAGSCGACRRFTFSFPFLLSPAEKYVGTKAVATGWGTLKEDGKPSCILQEVEVPILDNAVCVENTNYTQKMITENMMCAGYPGVGKKDSCQVCSTAAAAHQSDSMFRNFRRVTQGGRS